VLLALSVYPTFPLVYERSHQRFTPMTLRDPNVFGSRSVGAHLMNDGVQEVHALWVLTGVSRAGRICLVAVNADPMHAVTARVLAASMDLARALRDTASPFTAHVTLRCGAAHGV